MVKSCENILGILITRVLQKVKKSYFSERIKTSLNRSIDLMLVFSFWCDPSI